MQNFFGQGGAPGQGPPQQGQQPGQQQGRQAQPSNPWMSQLGGGGATPMGNGMWSVGGPGGDPRPDDSGIRAAEQALMQAQAAGAPPSQLMQMQMNLQNAQRDYQESMGNWQRGQQQAYTGAMSAAAQQGPPGIGGAPGPPSRLQQDPFLAQLIAGQYGQSGGGGIRS